MQHVLECHGRSVPIDRDSTVDIPSDRTWPRDPTTSSLDNQRWLRWLLRAISLQFVSFRLSCLPQLPFPAGNSLRARKPLRGSVADSKHALAAVQLQGEQFMASKSRQEILDQLRKHAEFLGPWEIDWGPSIVQFATILYPVNAMCMLNSVKGPHDSLWPPGRGPCVRHSTGPQPRCGCVRLCRSGHHLMRLLEEGRRQS